MNILLKKFLYKKNLNKKSYKKKNYRKKSYKKKNYRKIGGRRSSSVRRSAALKIQNRFRKNRTNRNKDRDKVACRKSFKACIKRHNPQMVFSSSTSGSGNSDGASYYEKIANKNPLCKKQYKVCRGYDANENTSNIIRQYEHGFFNKTRAKL
tara:strand:- start:23 stop:478 length:456 start_codon:yes stop_codon:yes gene_type:complete